MYESEYTGKADVYSFGLVLYELFAEKLAFHGLSEPQIMKRVGFGQRGPITASIPGYVGAYIQKNWAPDPADRPSFDQICAFFEFEKHPASDRRIDVVHTLRHSMSTQK